MRRWLAILLLVFMPFQSSWAAWAAYCAHESGAQARHLGHHDHEHRPFTATSEDLSISELGAAALELDDCHSHCQCVAVLPLASSVPMIAGTKPMTAWASAGDPTTASSPPERPQWLGHA